MRLTLILWSLFVGQAHAQCEQAVTADEFGQRISKGTAAFSNLKPMVFKNRCLGCRKILPCVNEPLHDSQVLALHRLRAFDYFLSKNPGQTTLYLRAVLAASPNYDLWMIGRQMVCSVGTRSGSVLANRTVSRHSETDGWNHLHRRPKESSGPARSSLCLSVFSRSRRRVFSVGLSSQVSPHPAIIRRLSAASVIFEPFVGGQWCHGLDERSPHLLAVRAENQFWDSATPCEQLVALQQRANGLSWASFAMGTVAVGTGVTALWSGAFWSGRKPVYHSAGGRVAAGSVGAPKIGPCGGATTSHGVDHSDRPFCGRCH